MAERRWLGRLGGLFRTLCGWLLVYTVAGGALGFAVTGRQHAGPTCYPVAGMFGTLDSSCPEPVATLFWLVVAGIPRLLLIFPAMAISLSKVALQFEPGFWQNRFYEALRWGALALPVLLLLSTGVIFWARRQRVVAVLLAAALSTEVGALLFIG